MYEPIYLPMARSALDRDYLSRLNENLFQELNSKQQTRILPIFNGKVLLTGSATDVNPELRLLETEHVPDEAYVAYLGKAIGNFELDAGSAVILAVLNQEIADQIEPDPENWHQLRKTGAGLSDLGIGLYAQALALSNWHAAHQFCPKCGSMTQVTQAGWVRKCTKDGTEVYPRTDPAIIVSIIDSQDRILLGSQTIWESNRWSILAGFVEPGESLSAAVVREMFEESGMKVVEPVYRGSQSWPFPYSLMVGFTAKLSPESDGIPIPDGDEIAKLRWFSRDEIRTEAAEMMLPGRLSIARALIEEWYGVEIISASELT
jgi:NAD+ diphosphatase